MLTMNTPLHRSRKQQGSMLLEALISILIFSIGILAIVGLQASSVKMSSDAKYRADASLLASQYVNTLWATVGANFMPVAVGAPPPPTATASFDPAMFANYTTGGTAFSTWLASVQAALPNANATVVINTTVTCDYTPCAAVMPSGTQQEILATANISITWQMPGSASSTHTYATSAQIAAQKKI
jgi:type IV pilus assembly protein PilV